MEDLLDLVAFGGINVDEAEDALLLNILGNPIQNQRNRAVQHGRLNLEDMHEDNVRLEFRFQKDDLERLAAALQMPLQFRTDSRHTTSGLEGLCICLRRLAYPNRLYDLERLFGLSAQYISDIANTVINHIYDNYHHLLVDLHNLGWLNHDRLRLYGQVVEDKNAPLYNCWGFIDGTARAICRPSVGQEEYFSGHKRFHCVKYQSVLCPDGIIASLIGAYPGRRHDAGILRDSNLYPQLEDCCCFPNGDRFVLYGDPAYGTRELLISPFRNRRLTAEQQQFNTRMSTVRQSVEWGFGKIIAEFAFLDYKKNQKLLLQDISKMYVVGTLLTNCHTCLYGGQTAQYFNIAPPQLEEYLGRPMN